MKKVKVYSVTHGLGRASICTADADAIVEQVNTVTMSNGDSMFRERVQAELDLLISRVHQHIYRIEVVETIVDLDE